MSKTYSIILADGTLESVTGDAFFYEIDGKRFKFLVHFRQGWTISEVRTGRKIDLIPQPLISAHLGDKKAAARQVLDKLIESRDPKHIRKVIEAARRAA